ncbi:uncharacterized protein [Miscanthus floridulus]|uniref:uncharacterized protein isoform X1 n=1 Tax=Miscanthus floridulus TaxID=154761 RepID=UPI003459FECF
MVALVESEEEEDDDAALVTHRKRSSDSSSSGAPVPAAPLLSQGGGDIFAAVVPPMRSSFGFMKKKIAESSSSPSLQSTSCQTSSAPLRTESQDLEHTVTEVAVRGMESTAANLPALEVTVAIAAGSSKGLAVASQEIALVVPSSPRPASPSLLASGGPPLADDVVQQFDATHRLSELTAA